MTFRPAALVAFLLRLYRLLLSPLLGPACRYHPSCSRYAEEAFLAHGLARAVTLSLRRVCRCHPWAQGGFDPVPPPQASHRSVAPRF